MQHTLSEKGQALILIALAAIGLFAFAALAIDGSRAFSNKRNAQNAADTAVLAAALRQIRTGSFADAEVAAKQRAEANGYLNNVNGAIVDVDLCSNVVDKDGAGNVIPIPGDQDPVTGNALPCEGVPAAQASEYIRVRIISEVPATFGRVIGRETLQSAVEAIARVQGSSSTSSSGGQALVGLRQNGCSICANGNVNLDVNGSGIFSNSTSSTGDCSMDYEGNGTYTSDGGYTVATGGALCRSGTVVVNGTVQAGDQVPYPPNISIPPPTFSCSGPNRTAGDAVVQPDGTKVYPPGNYNTHLDLNGSGKHTFAAGNYCFNGGVTINGSVQATANNVNFRLTASSFQINGNSTFTCADMMVHSVGGTGMEFNGNGSNNCTGVTFYMESGKVVWNGNVAQTFKAPTSGPYKGLLIYLPYGNGSELTINGNSGNELTGSIIAPSSPITINGNSGTAGLHTQVIGYFITLNGNSNTIINYNADEQYNPPAAPTIELTK